MIKKQKRMKKLAFIGAVMVSLTSFSQDVFIENEDQNKILFRGFENHIKIGSELEDFTIEAVNCEVTQTAGKNYLVKVNSNARTAMINFLSNGKIIDSETFVVQNLPSPDLFWGEHVSGSTLPQGNDLAVKYTPGISLRSNFEVVSWSCELDGKEFNGQGNTLSTEFIEQTGRSASGDKITIIANVKGPDGIVRKISGSWVKEG
jgi:hypothetical protein